MKCRALTALLGLVAIMLAAQVSLAWAQLTPDSLVSGSSTVEADYATQPAIAADGQYVVFAGSMLGAPGIFRRDLQTGELDTVVSGAGAGAPSVSANGQYVSFTSSTDPSTGDAECSTVYEANMASPLAPTYTVISAPSGQTSSLTYAGTAQTGCPGGGSATAPGVSMSANGNVIAFTVVGQSDLMTGVPADTSTPGSQVAVRTVSTDTTTLVSQTMSSDGGIPEPVPNGAAMTDQSTTPSSGATVNADPSDSTAAISADGSTVAWEGINIPSQAPAASQDGAVGYPKEYDEPLWRQIDLGAGAPTRRVIGGDDPTCGCYGPLDTQWGTEQDIPRGSTSEGDVGPDRGSFLAPATGFGGNGAPLQDITPSLSANGQVVAILSTQPLVGQDPPCTVSACSSSVSANAYVVNMAQGLTRMQAITRLTQWAGNDFSTSASGETQAGTIDELAISPEGNRVAFVTRRTEFPLAPPALVTPQLSPVNSEQLYLADLGPGTMQVASIGYDGQPANGSVLDPQFSADDGPITFASAATNLVYGALSDAQNGNAPEVFAITEITPPVVPGIEVLGAPPPVPSVVAKWELGASVGRRRDGTVVLAVRIPGAGSLSAVARTRLAKGAATGHGHRAGARSRRRLVTRTVARAHTNGARAGVVALTLRPATSLKAQIARNHGLYGTITLTFSAAGHPRLTDELPIEFTAPLRRHRHRRGGHQR